MAANQSYPLVGYRYLVEGVIGAGGMGVVHTARDRLTGARVALKTIVPAGQKVNFGTPSSEDVRIALAREFRTLASLRHPHIISVLDYGFDSESKPYFTMELLTAPKTILEAAVNRPYKEKIAFLVQTLQALAYLHRYGILHRDLKPENVLVVDSGVKMLDFGLSVARGKAEDEETSGTLAYIAPEVLRGRASTEASDLYAVGVMAYEIFAGRHPFNNENTSRLINDVLNTPPDVNALDIAFEMALLIERLLAKEPQDRYADALHVIRELNEATGLSFPVETIEIRESFLQAAPFAGRDEEIALLLKSLDEMFLERGSAWLIGGESGVGKSRLLDEFRTYVLVRGAQLLRGQDVKEGGNPYQPWRDVLRRLCLSGELTVYEMSVLKPVVPDIGTLLNEDVPDAPELDAGAAQDRLFATIEKLLRTQSESQVIILEDLHWADTASLLLLERLARVSSEIPMLIIATYRDDERPLLPDNVPGMNVLKLKRLAEGGIEQLAVSMLGEAGHRAEVIKLLQKESDGNVFFLIEVVRALAEQSGYLSNIGTMVLPEKVFPGGMREVVKRRLERVSEEARPLLNLAAVIGRQIDEALLGVLAPDVDLQRWFSIGAHATVLEVEDAQWRFANNKLRDGILEELSAEALQKLHHRVAEAIESHYKESYPQPAALAYHWEMGEEKARAGHWYYVAGKLAQEAYAPEAAIEYYNKALAFIPQDAQNTPRRLEIYDGLGKMLRWQTRFDEAEQIYNAMRDLAQDGDRVRFVRALIGLGDVKNSQGDRESALVFAEQAEQAARTTGAAAQVDLVEALGNKAWALYRLRRRDEALVVAEEGQALGQKLNLLGEVARSQSLLAILHFMQGQHQTGIEYVQSALNIARDIGDRRDVGIKLNNLGEMYRLLDDFPNAVSHFEQALVIFKEIGYRDAELALLTNLASVRLSLKEYSAAEADLQQVIELVGAGEWWGLPEAYRTLIDVYSAQEKWFDALEIAQQALELAQKTKDQDNIGKIWRTLGTIGGRIKIDAIINEETYTPVMCFEESLKVFEKEDAERAYSLRAWGQYEAAHGSDDKADALLTQARALFARLEMPDEANM